MDNNKSSQIIDIKKNGFDKYLITLPVESQENAKKKYASMAVRFWFYAEDADGYKKRNERQKIMNFIQLFFSEESLFPQNTYPEEERKYILKDLIDSESLEVDLHDIVQYLLEMPMQIRESFFYDACYIVSLDKQVVKKEVDFLIEFGKKIEIQEKYKNKLFQFFWID
jgi:predicted nucleic acid-binding protein